MNAGLIGGPEHREIVIVEHQSSWPAVFEDHGRLIRRSLGDVARRIDHVGSTAVPELPAKPIIDIQVSVESVEDEGSYVDPLTAAGYVLRVRESGHRMFRTTQLDVHVHVCDVASRWERLHLLFRDWLRISPEDRDLYAGTKRTLAAQDWPTMNHYADAKSEVIAAITVRAEAWAHQTGWTVIPDLEGTAATRPTSQRFDVPVHEGRFGDLT